MAISTPTKRKTWLFSGTDAAITDGLLGSEDNYKTLLLAMHDALLALGFTVALCSDASTVAASNLWDSIADISFEGNGFLASGAAHSWVVWEHPVRGSQVCFDCNNGAGNGRIASMAFSPGGNFTGGTTSQRATASDEVYPYSSSSGGGTFINWAGTRTTSFVGWVIVMHASDDANTRVVIWNETNNEAHGMFFWEELANPQGDFVNDLFGWFGGGSQFNESSTIVDTARWLVGVDAGGSSIEFLPGSVGYTPSGLGYTNRLTEGTAGTNNDLESGTPASYPFIPVCALLASGGVGGALVDLYFGNDQPTDDATGQTMTYPVSTTEREWFQRQNLILPWTGDSTLPMDAVSSEEAAGYAIDFGLGVTDITNPVVDNYSPSNGSTIEGTDPIFFDVTDDGGGFSQLVVWVDPGDGGAEVVYAEGAFRGTYGNLSQVTSISGGSRFEVRRFNGWLGTVTLHVNVVDLVGLVA